MTAHQEYTDIDHKLINLNLVDNTTGQEDTDHALWPESISLITFWRMYNAIHEIKNFDAAVDLVEFGLFLGGKDAHGLSRDDIWEILRTISHRGDERKRYTKEVDRLLSLTHSLLDIEQLTYTEAAAFASRQLKKTISTDAWRKRVTRWAEEEGLEPPRVKQGRPRKKTGQNNMSVAEFQ